jgi:uncharacterized protein (TIGR02271 family)
MITLEEVPAVLGRPVYDGSHQKVGTAEHIYLDRTTGQPEWVTVRTGLFGRKETFVPLSPAQLMGDELVVPYTKDQIKNAPSLDIEIGEEELPAEEESEVYTYYGMAYRSDMADEAAADLTAERYQGSEAMTRSEEHLVAGTQNLEAGRVRLRKYVTVEEETVTVPVRKERVTVEREPVGMAATAGSQAEIAEEEQEMILHEERPVVTTETEAVERVRLQKETVTDQETVRGKVRKEHIEVDEEGTPLG